MHVIKEQVGFGLHPSSSLPTASGCRHQSLVLNRCVLCCKERRKAWRMAAGAQGGVGFHISLIISQFCCIGNINNKTVLQGRARVRACVCLQLSVGVCVPLCV